MNISDPAIQNSLVYIIGAFMGILINWLVKWLNKEVDCIMDMFRTEPRRTAAAFIGQIGVITAFIGTGALTGLTPFLAFVQGTAFGSAVDAWMNKGKRKEWTDEERAAKQSPPKD